MTARIGVLWSNRSEEGLLQPVIKALKEEGFEVMELNISDDWYHVPEFFHNLEGKELPDAIICPFDRPPVTLAAYFLYHADVPIIQLHAGDISSGTYDDMDRWCITAWTTYHFCAGEVQAERVRDFLQMIRRPRPWNVCVSGVTHLDDLEDAAEPPDGDYDVVVYNPPTKAPEKMLGELVQIKSLLNKDTYWLEPNGDPGSEAITKFVKDVARERPNIWHTPSMEHTSFQGLLSRARRVIGNSSCLYLEAPFFGCEVVQIGERNRIRESVELKRGGSKVIARKLKEWLKSEETQRNL